MVSKLNRIDLRTAEIKSELDDLRMYESVNESKYRVEYEDKDDKRHYIEIKASSEEKAEQKATGLDGFRTIKSIELVKEDLQLDVDLYSKENPGIFTKADEKVQVTIPGRFSDNEGDTALEKALADLGKEYTSYKVKDVKELNEDEIDEEIETSLTPNEIGDEAVEKEADSAAYESLQETLRKKLQDRLK